MASSPKDAREAWRAAHRRRRVRARRYAWLVPLRKAAGWALVALSAAALVAVFVSDSAWLFLALPGAVAGLWLAGGRELLATAFGGSGDSSGFPAGGGDGGGDC
jgi:uncharacterized membrane protein YgcG